MLLEAGARTEQRDADGRTALNWAMEKGHDTIVEYLLAYGADNNHP